MKRRTVTCQILIPEELHYRFKLLVVTKKSNLRERIVKLIEDDVTRFENERANK